MSIDTAVARDGETVDAVGKASEALEYVERARGHLFAFHQLIGRADFLFEEAARLLADLGHGEEASSRGGASWAATCSRGGGRSRSSRASTTTTTRQPRPR